MEFVVKYLWYSAAVGLLVRAGVKGGRGSRKRGAGRAGGHGRGRGLDTRSAASAARVVPPLLISNNFRILKILIKLKMSIKKL